MTSRLTYDSQSPKTEGGLCVLLSLGPETHSLQQGSARNCGRVKTRYVPLPGYRDAMQWGQQPWAMAAQDLQQGVSCFKCTCIGGHQLGLLSWEGDLWSLPRLLWAATLGMEAAPLLWLLFNNT